MKNIYPILAVLGGICLAGCVEISDIPYERKRLVEMYGLQCQQEATIAVYDDEGAFEVPGCVDYYYYEQEDAQEKVYVAVDEPVLEAVETEEKVEENKEEAAPQKAKFRKIKRTVKRITKTIPQVEEEIDVDAIDGEFPEVESNKHVKEVVLEDLNSHVLAYCRGSEQEVEICVSRLEHTCYIHLREIPKFAAKYDFLKTGTYPTRRWREGEYFPRW